MTLSEQIKHLTDAQTRLQKSREAADVADLKLKADRAETETLLARLGETLMPKGGGRRERAIQMPDLTLLVLYRCGSGKHEQVLPRHSRWRGLRRSREALHRLAHG